MDRPEYAVFVGLDVGKEEHHACALGAHGHRIHDQPLPQSQARMAEVLARCSNAGRCWSWSISLPLSERKQ